MENEEKLEKIILELGENYRFVAKETEDLFNGKTTLFKIIDNRIRNLYYIIDHRYNDKNIKTDILNLDLEKILCSKENIKERIESPILELKIKINEIEPTVTWLIKDMDDIIRMIEKSDEILNKYDKEYFNKTKDFNIDDFFRQRAISKLLS